jgi:hypothetical protein
MTAISLTQARAVASSYLDYMARGERMSMDMSSDDAMQVCRAVMHLTRDSASQDDEQPCANTRCILAGGHAGECVPLSSSPMVQDARPTESDEARDFVCPRGCVVLDDEVEGDSLCGTVSAANGRQVGGTHYGLRAYQHWDMVIDFGLDYFQGQITKYVMRWNKKNGVQDLEKAKHFLEKYITEINAGKITND